MSLPVLVVEDRRSLADMLAETFRRDGYEVEVARRGDDAVAALSSRRRYLAVVTDLRLPGADGLAVLRAARRTENRPPVFLITGYATVATAVEALKEGASDYFEKPLDMERVLAALRAVAEAARGLGGERADPLVEIIGDAPTLVDAVTALRRVAPTDATVLLLGPSGSGKELFARALHRLSARSNGPFVAFNCAAVPDTLLESELFGHERGAFTGATARHVGRFEQADRGTLFLDEIGEVPVGLQTKLLRALEAGRVARLGGEGDTAIDVRVVAATNKDLENAVAGGAFRRDLYHRLAVFPIRLPALAERRGDIPALAIHMLERAAARHGLEVPALAPAALAALVLPRWPGNVRELANLVERVLILTSPAKRVRLEDLGLDVPTCRAAIADRDTRDLAARLAGPELETLARFLTVPLSAFED